MVNYLPMGRTGALKVRSKGWAGRHNLLASKPDLWDDESMPKIPPQTPPTSPQLLEEDTSSTQASPNQATTSEVDLIESISEGPSTAGEKGPPSTEDALASPGSTGNERREAIAGAIPESPPEVAMEAATMDALITFEAGSMSGDDVIRTIEVIEAMEAIISSSIERQLKSPIPRKRGFMDKLMNRQEKITVPGPDGKPRNVSVRQPDESSPSISQRSISDEEKNELQVLLKELPRMENPINPRRTFTEFTGRMTRLLYQEKVPLHELREILPILESGEMVPLSDEATTKSAPELRPVVSKDLRKKARALGLLKE